MTTTEAALIMSADETGSINQSVSSNEIPNNAVGINSDLLLSL